mmetsp:Transcript_22569/g.70751  ORF Transcript_22569/g.70751 Transcript_22569/m.70751 type:complete len:82 (+) Transcript_22569:802-1047(+)
MGGSSASLFFVLGVHSSKPENIDQMGSSRRDAWDEAAAVTPLGIAAYATAPIARTKRARIGARLVVGVLVRVGVGDLSVWD